VAYHALPMPHDLDPLRAKALHERVRALYMARGHNRADFARLMGVGYTVVANWDSGKYVMSVPLLRKAATVLGVSTDDLVFGYDADRPAPPVAPAAAQGPGAPGADYVAIRLALDGAGASPLARAALAEHIESPRGQLQHVTTRYAVQYCVTYDALIAEGTAPEQAELGAFRQAVQMRSTVSALTPTSATTVSQSAPTHSTLPIAPPAPAPSTTSVSPAGVLARAHKKRAAKGRGNSTPKRPSPRT
jgi:transcriptional regulator with XRE-family HTH domain